MGYLIFFNTTLTSMPTRRCTLSRRRLSTELVKLERLLDRLIDHDIAHSTQFDDVLHSEFPRPPKSALLTMANVRRLHRYRHRSATSRAKLPAPIYVVEPQTYNKVTALTHKNMMFEENSEGGYFHSRSRRRSNYSGLALSGGGGYEIST